MRMLTGLLCVSLIIANSAAQGAEGAAENRRFVFRYQVEVHDLPAEKTTRFWLPVPRSDASQQVTILAHAIPADWSTANEPVHGNRILYFESQESTALQASVTYLVERSEVRTKSPGKRSQQLSEQTRNLYLSANRLVPLTGDHLRLVNSKIFTGSAWGDARVLYDAVDDHVAYDKSVAGYGQGDVAWVCDSRTGNCTDFHSLFISWCRAKGIPARFHIGFPVAADKASGPVGGYHCWAEFYDSKRGWVPVDISEADKAPKLKEYFFGNLNADRVQFTTGRDLKLVPPQAGPPLNYFIYPYVEVDGKPLPKERINVKFDFSNVAKPE